MYLVLAARKPGLFAHQLRHQPTRVDTAHEEDAQVAMERRNKVTILKRRANSGDDRFLPGA
jgi:hypothetical protein